MTTNGNDSYEGSMGMVMPPIDRAGSYEAREHCQTKDTSVQWPSWGFPIGRIVTVWNTDPFHSFKGRVMQLPLVA